MCFLNDLTCSYQDSVTGSMCFDVKMNKNMFKMWKMKYFYIELFLDRKHPAILEMALLGRQSWGCRRRQSSVFCVPTCPPDATEQPAFRVGRPLQSESRSFGSLPQQPARSGSRAAASQLSMCISSCREMTVCLRSPSTLTLRR